MRNISISVQVYATPLRRAKWAVSFLAFAAATAPLAAEADPSVSATMLYTLGVSNSVSDTTIADVSPYFDDGFGNSLFGHTYAYPSGTNGSRSSGTGTFSINGVSLFEEMFTNNTGAIESFVIPFEIAAGEVGTNMATTAVGTQDAGVSAVITSSLNGGAFSTDFSTTATMTLVSDGAGTSQLTFARTGTNLAATTLADSTSGVLSGEYSWTGYDNSVSYTLNPGDTLDFKYTISSYADGSMSSNGSCTTGGAGGGVPTPGPTPVANTFLAAVAVIGGGGGCSNYAVGRIGDPFNPDPVPQFFNATTPGTPEPGTWLMIGLGFAALGFKGRRLLRVG